MIEKMKFLSITGPKADIDRVVDQYLSKYEIHLENALASLQSVQSLTPYIQVKCYRDTLNKAEELVSLLQDTGTEPASVSLKEAAELVEELDQKLARFNEQRKGLEEQRQKVVDQLEAIKPFRDCPSIWRRFWTLSLLSSVLEGFRGNIIPSLKIIFTRILTPCSANVFLMMSIYGVCILVPSQRRSRSMRSTLPCILSGSTFPKSFTDLPSRSIMI